MTARHPWTARYREETLRTRTRDLTVAIVVAFVCFAIVACAESDPRERQRERVAECIACQEMCDEASLRIGPVGSLVLDCDCEVRP